MPADDSAARGPIPLGPVGRYVIRNLERLREQRGLTYRQLADRLSDIGRPIPTLGLSRIEKGNRRVDADDLVALCVALEVSPAALLLPPDPGGDDDEVDLTERLSVPGHAARRWAAGHSPLPDSEAITWDRPGFVWRVREGELAELRQRIELLESASNLTRALEAQAIVAAVVTSAEGVLVGRRNDGRPPWTFIAGEQEPGERPEDTAIREVKEETGLRIQAGDEIGERVQPVTGRRMIYLAAVPTHGTDVFVGDEAELAEVRWVSLAEADELLPGMYAPVREHLGRELGEA
jgi:8-oxo-dGTP diphosphatase